MRAGEPVWVPGHSPVSGGAGQLDRQIEVLSAVPVPPPAIAMHFHVPSFTRRGQFFDMESLGYSCLRRGATTSPTRLHQAHRSVPARLVWVTMAMLAGDEPGLELADESPPEPLPEIIEVDVTIAKPPAMSVRGTTLPELGDHSVLSEAEWLGLDLTFGAEADIGEFGFYGPVKPLIDAMGPILGHDHRGGPADHRLHDLRIRHDERVDGSVRARLWYSA